MRKAAREIQVACSNFKGTVAAVVQVEYVGTASSVTSTFDDHVVQVSTGNDFLMDQTLHGFDAV